MATVRSEPATPVPLRFLIDKKKWQINKDRLTGLIDKIKRFDLPNLSLLIDCTSNEIRPTISTHLYLSDKTLKALMQ